MALDWVGLRRWCIDLPTPFKPCHSHACGRAAEVPGGTLGATGPGRRAVDVRGREVGCRGRKADRCPGQFNRIQGDFVEHVATAWAGGPFRDVPLRRARAPSADRNVTLDHLGLSKSNQGMGCVRHYGIGCDRDPPSKRGYHGVGDRTGRGRLLQTQPS